MSLRNKYLSILLTTLVAVSLILSACGGGAVETRIGQVVPAHSTGE